MPTTADAIEADIDAAIVPGFRNRLIARAQARAMIWRDGVLPPEAPAFSVQLSSDLHGYGYHHGRTVWQIVARRNRELPECVAI